MLEKPVVGKKYHYYGKLVEILGFNSRNPEIVYFKFLNGTDFCGSDSKWGEFKPMNVPLKEGQEIWVKGRYKHTFKPDKPGQVDTAVLSKTQLVSGDITASDVGFA